MKKRSFSGRERLALYFSSDGRCSNCGKPLENNFHADHIMPYSKGGETDVQNGQALCPACNLKKGAKMGSQLQEWNKPLRKWQEYAFRDFIQSEDKNLRIAHHLLSTQICEKTDLLDKALRQGKGKRSAVKTSNRSIIKPSHGTTSAYALSKLRKSKPDLHAKVLAGELSPNEAMIKAGFRVKTITIPLEPKKAAQALARHFKKSGLWKELLEQIKSVK